MISEEAYLKVIKASVAEANEAIQIRKKITAEFAEAQREMVREAIAGIDKMGIAAISRSDMVRSPISSYLKQQDEFLVGPNSRPLEIPAYFGVPKVEGEPETKLIINYASLSFNLPIEVVNEKTKKLAELAKDNSCSVLFTEGELLDQPRRQEKVLNFISKLTKIAVNNKTHFVI